MAWALFMGGTGARAGRNQTDWHTEKESSSSELHDFKNRHPLYELDLDLSAAFDFDLRYFLSTLSPLITPTWMNIRNWKWNVTWPDFQSRQCALHPTTQIMYASLSRNSYLLSDFNQITISTLSVASKRVIDYLEWNLELTWKRAQNNQTLYRINPHRVPNSWRNHPLIPFNCIALETTW